MTEELPDRAERAFEAHEAFERNGKWFNVTTTKFDGRVTVSETDDWDLAYTLEVRAPMLSAVTADTVGPAVEDGWFDTYDRRLEDTHMAVRQDVEFTDRRVFEEADDAVAVFEFEWGNADHVPDMAKAMTEYVEGTYMEGIVPGYDYTQPVSEMLSKARQSAGDGDSDGRGSGPMPL